MIPGSLRSERGATLIETVVVSFAILAAVLPTMAMLGRLSSAHSAVLAEATDIASWTARHGSVPDVDERFEVTVEDRGTFVVVTVTTTVDLIGIGGPTASIEVAGSAKAPISPFRSDP